MRNRLVFVGLAVLAAFGIACGSGSGDTQGSVDGTAAPAEGPVTAAIGQTITLTSTFLDQTDAVEVTLSDPEQHESEPGDFGSDAENGVFLVLSVTVVCTEGAYSANPFNFKFVAADGTVYEQAFAIGFDPGLNATELAKGQRTSGKIVFDVPVAALTGGKVQIDGIGTDFDKPGAYWAL